MLLEAPSAQLLERLTVGTQGSVHCQWCDHEFAEGDVAIVLFTQTADTGRWEVHRTYCTACNPSTIARPVLDRAQLLVQYRLGTCADSPIQSTELVALEPELIDSSEPVENPPVLETDENTDPGTSVQPPSPSSNEVEIETLPPSLSAPTTHHPETDSSVPPEEHPVPDGGAE
ncbi:hypothetical protein CV102_17740 [Natronococcus pandeyae]|uniref:DUF8112 domain-containing protein n=1 Tax=Natronococcus pandeyae TaxID=2055836 RepID=A0A8J8TRD3_9EURY|nr:hypothetical protein [Natronococcus pandeyae]TYL37447.1 hypothetical protein CV102_17740 [Natronococcus pandeyae]